MYLMLAFLPPEVTARFTETKRQVMEIFFLLREHNEFIVTSFEKRNTFSVMELMFFYMGA